MRSANNTTGYLIRVGDDIMFRVYDASNNFTDYEIYHYDMCVTIQDTDAYFYKNEDLDFIDYSPQTLGISNA
jgi:hypothetical protein